MTCQSDAVRIWANFFTGFTQGEGSPTPIEKIHRRVSQCLAAPDAIVTLNTWKDSPWDRANRIVRWRNGKPPRIIVVGYSYGGWSANRLCCELQAYDLEVEALILCDPVGRIFGRLPSLLSVLDVIPMTVPANVRRLYTFRQTCDRPRGCRVNLEKHLHAIEYGSVNAGTMWMLDQSFEHVPHVNMDDIAPFRETVLQVCCGGGS